MIFGGKSHQQLSRCNLAKEGHLGHTQFHSDSLRKGTTLASCIGTLWYLGEKFICSKNHGISSHWWFGDPRPLLGERNAATLENREKLTLVISAGDEILPRLSNYYRAYSKPLEIIKMLMNQSIQGFERCSLGVYLKTSNSTTTIATGWQIHKRDVETFRYQKNFPRKIISRKWGSGYELSLPQNPPVIPCEDWSFFHPFPGRLPSRRCENPGTPILIR